MVQGRWKLPGRSARAVASRSLPHTRARPAGAPSVAGSVGGRPALAPLAEDRAERRAIGRCLWGPYGRARSAWESPLFRVDAQGDDGLIDDAIARAFRKVHPHPFNLSAGARPAHWTLVQHAWPTHLHRLAFPSLPSARHLRVALN